MKKSTKKLRLSKETLATLQEPSLKKVAAGTTGLISACGGCSTDDLVPFPSECQC